VLLADSRSAGQDRLEAQGSNRSRKHRRAAPSTLELDASTSGALFLGTGHTTRRQQQHLVKAEPIILSTLLSIVNRDSGPNLQTKTELQMASGSNQGGCTVLDSEPFHLPTYLPTYLPRKKALHLGRTVECNVKPPRREQ
jgi:hypothetical protein